MTSTEFRERANSGLDEELERLAFDVIGACIEVHLHLGPSLPESVYRKALSHELSLRGISHVCESPVPVTYKGILVGEGRLDLLVAERLVIELKCAECLTEVHKAQALAYLQATGLQLALLINFNVAVLQDGIKRVIKSQKR